MILKTRITSRTKGFTALITTVLLATSVLAFAFTALGSAVIYSDAVNKRELRIQAGLNLAACLDTADLLVVKDYFFVGTSTLPKFGCTIHVSNDSGENHSVDATAELSGVRAVGHR